MPEKIVKYHKETGNGTMVANKYCGSNSIKDSNILIKISGDIS